MSDQPVFDLKKAIQDRQEREALRKAVAFTRDSIDLFRAPPGIMTGYRDLQARVVAAIEVGFEEGRPQYTDALSIASALMNMAAGIAGYALGSLPTSYGPHSAPAYWEEAGKRSLRTFKACLGAAVEDMVDKKVEPAPPAEPIKQEPAP